MTGLPIDLRRRSRLSPRRVRQILLAMLAALFVAVNPLTVMAIPVGLPASAAQPPGTTDLVSASVVSDEAVQAAGAPGTAQGRTGADGPVALLAVPFDVPGRLAEVQDAGLVVYNHLSSARGEILLVGAPWSGDGRPPELGFPAILVDPDTAGATYYMAYPPGPGHERFGRIVWADFGEVLLDLGDQVLLRATAAQAELLPDVGAEIVRIWLEPAAYTAPTEELAAPAAITADPIVQNMLSQVYRPTVSLYTAQLSGEQAIVVGGASYTIPTRYTYSGTPIQKAGQFVGEHLQSLGLSVEYHVWGSSGTPSTYPNVIGRRTGSANPNDIYIIGGHLDDMPSGAAAPGADDNGSGSVGTLIAADILTQYQWRCTLRFGLWTGEEQGLLGSKAYATRAKNNNETIKGYLNLDMIAYNGGAPNEINLFAKSSVPGSVNMMNLYADAISAYGLNLVPVKYTDNSLGNQSDNKSFWDQGYASILAIEDYYGDFNPRYHTVNDKLQYLDMAYYTDFVKASLGTFVHLTGCLERGTLAGQVTAAHNAAPIPGATVTMTRTAGFGGTGPTDGDGKYRRAVPAGSYAAAATAYGYLPASASGIGVADGVTTTLDFVLQPAPPVAPTVSISQPGGIVRLEWTHLPPNTAYQVHRSSEPYFTPGPDTWLATLNLPFSDPVTFDDTALDALEPVVEPYYVVAGMNVADQGAAASPVGRFTYALSSAE